VRKRALDKKEDDDIRWDGKCKCACILERRGVWGRNGNKFLVAKTCVAYEMEAVLHTKIFFVFAR